MEPCRGACRQQINNDSFVITVTCTVSYQNHCLKHTASQKHKWLILTDMIMHTEIVNYGGTYFLGFCVRYS